VWITAAPDNFVNLNHVARISIEQDREGRLTCWLYSSAHHQNGCEALAVVKGKWAADLVSHLRTLLHQGYRQLDSPPLCPEDG
jgi:hypothetical protein